MQPLESRASASSYFALCTVWVLLGSGFTVLALGKSGSGNWQVPLMAFVVAGGFALRLSGFQLRVGNGVLASRDGFFRTQSCRVSEIRSLDLQWVEQRWLWKRTSKLRIVITLINGRSLQINPKPFNSKSIATLQSLIHTSATR